MVLHGIILAGAMAFFFLFASQFESFCNDAIGPGNLPDTTQMTLQLARFIRHDGCLLLPMLLVMDFGICWLMQSMGGRKSLIIWGITVFFAAITTLALMIASFLVPFYPAFGINDGMKG